VKIRLFKLHIQSKKQQIATRIAEKPMVILYQGLAPRNIMKAAKEELIKRFG
tara:strand:- start:857 stop:1012 length:156 start_codon:yes stop_codon:yes gene_type:complete